jgi:hypothetical protein
VTSPPSVRAYKALLVLYPRPFRREYGEDMALLFAEQLRDESAWRVCARAATDLALTVPTRYLEAVMKSSTSPFLSALFGAVAAAGLVCAVVSGTNATLAISGVAVAVVAGGLSAASYHRNRPLGAPASAIGWKLAAAGGLLLTALIITVNVIGELPDGFWLPMVITGLAAVVLLAMGLILGIINHATGSPRHGDAR